MSLAADAPALVAVRDVGKVFRRSRRTLRAIAGIDLDIGQGEFVSLLGPSGCGKSTLLRLIGGLYQPDEGSVTVGGLPADSARGGKQFGLVPQSPSLIPWKTLDANVRFLSSLRRGQAIHPTMSDPEIAGLIAAVGLTGFERSYPHELSGGMQQRASLVRAFALGAPILLMDEPFAALDEITRADMRYLLLDLWQRTGTTVVFVTHSVTEAVALSDRVVLMAGRPGQIALEQPVDLPRPRTPDTEELPKFHETVRFLRRQLREHRD